ncbi:peptide/nickel transport system substrate-binding protein [Kitasatospora viridis]|uniref:Peptide/nickel transport system substrate-binding protein n=2 Tax=Kitasatospora viridis TaxID=281105 RepID=A0A561SEX2_9ACTN|nr:ABC transporter substrate-binding protein [Kitasatospora viridis]TWF73392.1 peptide/nickel transport system substrate-binding protein [Kitasatospora viridis]
MRKRRAVATVAGFVLVSGLATACGGTASGSAGGAFDPAHCQGGTLTVLAHAGQGKFDPAELYTSGGGRVPTLVFRTLTTRDHTAQGPASAKVVPDLATDTGEPSQDATVWTYHLKPGLKFEDGTPIKAADIKYGIERSFAPELPGGPPYLRDWLVGGATYQGPFKGAELPSIETPDDSTLVFHLTKPEGDFPFLATATQFAPVPKDKDTGTDYQKHPISSGPYKVVSNDSGKSIVLERNPYWSRSVDDQRLACPDRIVYTSGLDPAVVNQRLVASSGDDARAVSGDVDIDASVLARLNGDPGLKSRVATGYFGDTNYLAFNPNVKPFDNPAVRQAISYAVDRQAVINAVGGSAVAKPATTFLPDQPAFGYTPYDYFPGGPNGDPDKAKQLLAQAGYPNGLTITLSHSVAGSGNGPAVAAAVQQALAKAGITVKLDGSSSDDDYQTKTQTPATEPGFFLAGWGADWPSGGPFLAPIFDGRQILPEGNFNSAQLNDPQVNAAIDAANRLTDPAQAEAAWGALDAQLGKQAWTVPLYHPVYKRLIGKDVKNAYVSDWTGVYDLSRISVK